MNCNIYFFIGTQKGYSQYPDNYTKDIIANILAKTDRKINNSQFAISMNGKLAYLTYQYRYSDSKYFGVCCEYNGVVPSNFEYLFEFYDNLMQDILKRGEIIHYDSSGTMCPSIDYISDKVELINYYCNFISHNFDDELAKYIALPSQIYTSEKKKVATIAYGDAQEQLLDALNTYDNVIVSRENPYALGYANTLKKASDRISKLETELAKINRQKKQYRMVIFLVLAVGVCLVSLYSFNSDIKTLTHEAALHRNSIDSLNNLTQNQEIIISDLRSDLSSANNSLSSYKNKIGKHLPLIVTEIEMANNYNDGTHETNFGSTIYSKNTMFLAPRIKYIGLTSGTKKLLVKLYKPDGSLSTGNPSSETPKGYSYSSYEYIYEGENTRELNSWGGEQKGHWARGTYRIEVWYNNMCLKAKDFTIY